MHSKDNTRISNNFVSVIVPVFNDFSRLKKCLTALLTQSYPKSSFEIIVVDNGSTENLESISDMFNDVIFTNENKKSSYAARNKGISIAKGNIIAFTDSDCIPSPNWIEIGVDTLLRNYNCGLVAGKICLFFKPNKYPNVFELYENIFAFNQKKFINKHKFGATANLFTFKKVFDVVGHFDENFKSSGDRDWGLRVYKNGFNLIYNDKLCVNHPARSSFKQLYDKYLRLIGGEYLYNKKTTNYYKLNFIIHIFLDIIPPVITITRILKVSSPRYNYKFQTKMIISLLYLLIRYSLIIERIRLLFGAESKN